MNADIVSFDLKGNFAFFKKHDTNDIIYTTYNFIHRPAVLGIIGAILGYKGYSTSEGEPEYYKKLKNLKLGIAPKFENVPSKVILTYNNTSGLASKEKGGILQVQEQVMFDLKNKIIYTIYIDLESLKKDKIDEELIEKLNNHYSKFPLYFGKNEFFAYYDNVKYYEKCQIDPDELKKNKVNIKTIIPVIYLKNQFIIDVDLFDTNCVEDMKIMFEDLPVDFDNDFIYIKEKFGWLIRGKMIFERNDGIVKIKDESGSIEYIYIFNGKASNI